MEKNPYLRLVAAVLFAAVCAYMGAALYPRLLPRETAAVMAVEDRCSIPLEGIALRDEVALSLPGTASLLARDGQRLGGEAATAAMAGAAADDSPGSCIFLAFSDGLESLSPGHALPLSVERVRSLMAAECTDQKWNARLVQGFDWYYAALCDYGGRLVTGRCRLRFEGFDEDVKARLVELSSPENGERALLFRLTTGDTDYLKLRSCRAELILPGQ